MLTLYHYEICPYCVRVRMMLEACGFEYQLKILHYDDKTTTQRLAHTNLTPILALPDGTHLKESMDIVNYLVEKSNFTLAEHSLPQQISDALQAVKGVRSRLFKPRFFSLNLEELKTDSAQAYFLTRWKMSREGITHELEQTPAYIAQLTPQLAIISEALASEHFVYGHWARADIELFPSLRSLTCVKGLVFPERLNTYVNHHLAQARLAPLPTV